MAQARIYADYNATAPLRPEARARIDDALAVAGNASSIHWEGRKAKALLDESREIVAAAVGAQPADLIFTSGATEANNQALSGFAKANPAATIYLSALEHDSVRNAAKACGAAVEEIPTLASGVADLDWLGAQLSRRDPARGAPLVCLMLVNNETGIVQPVAQAAERAHAAGGYLLCDAVQGLGKEPIDIENLGADYLSLSAHKLGGLAGAGALIVRGSSPMAPLIHGGGQERGRRAGTENLIGAVAFAGACLASHSEEQAHVRSVRDSFEETLRAEAPSVRVIGADMRRAYNTSCIVTTGLPAETGVVAMDLAGVACSAGAACSSGKIQSSRVLTAMGLDEQESKAALRFSFGWANGDGDGIAAARALAQLVKRAQAQRAA